MENLFSEIFLILFVFLVMFGFQSKLPKVDSILKGLIVYFPPDQEKIEKALANPKKFVINCGHIDENFSHKSPYFIESEYLILLVSFGTVSVGLGLILHYLIDFTLNTSGYIVLMMVFFCVKGAYSNLFDSGFRNPDNWMGLFYALGLFSFTAIFLQLDHFKLFDFNFHFSLTLFGLQITSVLYPLLQISFSFNHLFFALFYSSLLSLFIFPYFKYLFRTTIYYYSSQETPFEMQGIKSISPYYKFSIFFPFFISLLWLNLISNPLKILLTTKVWEYLRISLVILFSLVRLYVLRREVQNLLDQGKSLIYDIIRNPSEKNKKESEIQCTAIGSYAWPLAYQSLCYSLLIISLCLLLLCKGEIHNDYPEPVITLEYRQPSYKDLDENEFIFNNSAIVTPSMSISYFKEIKDLEKAIKECPKENSRNTNQALDHILKAKLVPWVFYRDSIECAIWLYHLSSSCIIFLSILYKRRFYLKQKNS